MKEKLLILTDTNLNDLSTIELEDCSQLLESYLDQVKAMIVARKLGATHG